MHSSPSLPSVAIIGSGPTGLMAATRISANPGVGVDLYERRGGFGRKLLIAGSSGLNISHCLPSDSFAAHYDGGNAKFWTKLFSEFGPAEWVAFIEKELGLETFVGTSQRYFVREMKASGLLAAWRKLLESRGVRFHAGHELSDFKRESDHFHLTFGPSETRADFVVFALGGGSWEDSAPVWPKVLEARGLSVEPFLPANVGYTVGWTEGMRKEAEGKPLKKIRFGNVRGEKDGELVVTAYGLEGTPVYFFGEPGAAWIDLKPDLTEAAILTRLEAVRENLAPIRRVKQKLELCDASLALLFHHLPEADRRDLKTLVKRLKRFPIMLGEPRPLTEAISSRGGLALSEIHETLELKKFPGLYAGGEMLAWHAPTGGFLIQAAVSMGARIGDAIGRRIPAQDFGNG